MVEDNSLGPLFLQGLLLGNEWMITGASSTIFTHFLSKKHAGLLQAFKAHLPSTLPLHLSNLRYDFPYLHPLFCYGVFIDLMRKMSKLTFLLPRSLHMTAISVSSVWHLWIYGKPHLCPHLKLGCTQWIHPREQFCKSPQRMRPDDQPNAICVHSTFRGIWMRKVFARFCFLSSQTCKVGMSLIMRVHTVIVLPTARKADSAGIWGWLSG